MRNDNKQKKPDENPELVGYEDIVDVLRSMPEREWRDISGDVMSELARRRALIRRFTFVSAAAAAIAVVVGVPLATEFASRDGGSTNLEAVAPTSSGSTELDQPATDFLLAAQESDGMWDPSRWGGSERYATAVTGFAMMALAGRDNAEFDAGAARAAYALRAMQLPDGRFVEGEDDALMLNHAVATVALLRLYSSGRFPELFSVIDGAVNHIRYEQNASGGWGRGGTASLWLTQALSLASDMGWQDKNGELRRSIMWLERNTGIEAEALAAADTLDGKKAVLNGLCSAMLEDLSDSTAGGAILAASFR